MGPEVPSGIPGTPTEAATAGVSMVARLAMGGTVVGVVKVVPPCVEVIRVGVVSPYIEAVGDGVVVGMVVEVVPLSVEIAGVRVVVVGSGVSGIMVLSGYDAIVDEKEVGVDSRVVLVVHVG